MLESNAMQTLADKLGLFVPTDPKGPCGIKELVKRGLDANEVLGLARENRIELKSSIRGWLENYRPPVKAAAPLAEELMPGLAEVPVQNHHQKELAKERRARQRSQARNSSVK